MAFTREFIRSAAKESGVEIPKEFEDALVQEHLSARNTYAEKQVKAWQDEHPAETAPKVEDSEQYKALQKQFDDYKADVSAKETRAAKKAAGRDILKAAGVPEKQLDILLAAYDVDKIELDETGKAKDVDGLTTAAKTQFASFIPTVTESGTNFATPPATPAKNYTPADIRKMTPAEINANFDAIKASLKGEN